MGPDPAAVTVELPVPVVAVDRGGVVTFANARLSALVGGAAPLGRPLDEVLSLPGAFAAVAEKAADPTSPQAELSCRTADGRALLLAATGRMLPDGSVLAVLVDETERREAAMQHAEQTQALRLLAEFPEKNPGPVGRVARDGTVVMANAAARAFLGEDDIRGRSWIALCPGMTDDLWQRILGGVRVTHEAEQAGTCILFTHVVADAGDLVFVYGADVTARRESERLLAEQAAQLAEVARFPEMNPGPVLRMGADARVLMANAAARKVFGEELLGRSWLELCPGVDTVVWKQIETADEVRFHDARIGEQYYVFAHRWDERTQLMFVFGADVSAQKSAERALRHAEKMATLGTLAAGVAHELNNPAAAARRAADQLAATFTDLQESRQRLDDAGLSAAGWRELGELERRSRAQAGVASGLTALERSDRETDLEDWLAEHGVESPWELAPELLALDLTAAELDRLAAQLPHDLLGTGLRWATAAHGMHGLTREVALGTDRISEIVAAMKSYTYLGQAPVQAVDVHEGLDSTLVILSNKLKHGIEVRKEYDRSIPLVAAYGSELNQVWTNLIDNAVQALEIQGTITIRTRLDGDAVVVEVADDGPGIPEEIQHQVFDPFFTTKEPGKGSGLGLSTCYSIITEKHRGTIGLSSRPGSTTFVVRLPVDAAPSGR